MNTAQDIINALRTLKLNRTELSAIAQAWKEANRRNLAAAADTFRIGDIVTFVARHRQHKGMVTKVNLKTIKVRVDGDQTVTWSVSPNLLHKANG